MKNQSNDQSRRVIYRKGKKQKFHLWDNYENDTFCRMWSTGGITSKSKYKFSANYPDAPICKMCATKERDMWFNIADGISNGDVVFVEKH